MIWLIAVLLGLAFLCGLVVFIRRRRSRPSADDTLVTDLLGPPDLAPVPVRQARVEDKPSPARRARIAGKPFPAPRVLDHRLLMNGSTNPPAWHCPASSTICRQWIALTRVAKSLA